MNIKKIQADIQRNPDDNELITAYGYLHKNGYWTPEKFQEHYKFPPTKYPEYFRVTETGLVVAKPEYREYCKVYFDMVDHNWNALGVQSADESLKIRRKIEDLKNEQRRIDKLVRENLGVDKDRVKELLRRDEEIFNEIKKYQNELKQLTPGSKVDGADDPDVSKEDLQMEYDELVKDLKDNPDDSVLKQRKFQLEKKLESSMLDESNSIKSKEKKYKELEEELGELLIQELEEHGIKNPKVDVTCYKEEHASCPMHFDISYKNGVWVFDVGDADNDYPCDKHTWWMAVGEEIDELIKDNVNTSIKADEFDIPTSHKVLQNTLDDNIKRFEELDAIAWQDRTPEQQEEYQMLEIALNADDELNKMDDDYTEAHLDVVIAVDSTDTARVRRYYEGQTIGGDNLDIEIQTVSSEKEGFVDMTVYAFSSLDFSKYEEQELRDWFVNEVNDMISYDFVSALSKEPKNISVEFDRFSDDTLTGTRKITKKRVESGEFSLYENQKICPICKKMVDDYTMTQRDDREMCSKCAEVWDAEDSMMGVFSNNIKNNVGEIKNISNLQEMVKDYLTSLVYDARDEGEDEVLKEMNEIVKNAKSNKDIFDMLEVYGVKDDFILYVEEIRKK